MKVLIGIPTYEGKLNIELVRFLDKMILPEGTLVGKTYVTRTPIHMARNILIERMLDEGYDKLIMIDDDEYPLDKDCFQKLIQTDREMVSGIVRLRMKKENLCVLRTETYNEGDLQGMYKYTPYQELPSKGIFEIGNAGCGLVCLDRRVCAIMWSKYMKQPFESKNIVYVKQEDGTFCEFGFHTSVDMSSGKPKLCNRVLSEDYLFFERAIREGFKLYANGQCGCVHLGEQEKIMPYKV